MTASTCAAPCDRKRTFRTCQAAERERRRIWRTRIDPFRLNVFRCEIHGGWHLGNRPLFVRYDDENLP